MLMLCISVPGFSQMVEHVVDKGETFASIAQKYGMTEKQLKEANPKYKGVFFAGMTLNIPQKYANASSATPQAQQSPEPPQETTAPKQTVSPRKEDNKQLVTDYKDGIIERGDMKGDVFTGFLFDPEKGYIYNGSKYCKTKDGKFITGTKINLITKNREVFNKSKSQTFNNLDQESQELFDTYYPLFAFYKLKFFDKVEYKDLNKVGDAYVFIPNKKDLKKTSVLWTGNIEDGLISGEGVGITYIDPDYVYVKCDDFKNGFPTGSLTYRIMKPIWNGAYMRVDETYYEISSQPSGTYLVNMTSEKEKKEFVVSKEGSFLNYSQAQRDKDLENDMKLAKGIYLGLLAVAAFNSLSSGSESGLSSSSSYSSSSRDEESSSDSSSSDTEETYSCRVHLTFSDGKPVYEGSGIAYFKGILNTSSQRYETDDKGYATITWPKSKGKVIDTLTLDRKIMFHDVHTVDELNLVDGGRYEICMDCK